MKYLTSHLLVLLLLAAPLSAQLPETITLEPAVVNQGDIIINFDSLRAILEDVFAVQEPDSAEVARLELEARALRATIDWYENCGCVNQGTSRTTTIATGGIALFLGLIWWELRSGNRDGVDGKDGAKGATGEPGSDGADGKDGADGYGEG